MGLQQIVYTNVYRRGYLSDRTPDHIINSQLLKSVEELGEVARHVFDGRRPPVEEIADVVIPLLVMAEECGYDLLSVIDEKSRSDVWRGVRSPGELPPIGSIRLSPPGTYIPAEVPIE